MKEEKKEKKKTETVAVVGRTMPGVRLGRPPTFGTPKEMERAIEKWKEWTEENGRAPTLGSLAFHLGLSRDAVANYSVKPEFLGVIKRAKRYCEDWLEQELATRKTTPLGLFFILKNGYGWKDKHEIEHNHNYSMGEFLQKLQKLAKTEDKQLPTIEGEIVNNPPTVE